MSNTPQPDDEQKLNEIMEDLIVGHNFEYARKALLEWHRNTPTPQLESDDELREQLGAMIDDFAHDYIHGYENSKSQGLNLEWCTFDTVDGFINSIISLRPALLEKAVSAARIDQIHEDMLSLEFLTDEIGRDVFQDEALLIEWRDAQLKKLQTTTPKGGEE